MIGGSNGSSGLQPALEPTAQPQSHLQKDIRLIGSIKRLDSKSDAVDEFHDALG